MILLLENFVDASVTKAEMSEMKVSIGVVGVRLFVPVWITINSGCSWSAFCKTSLAWSTLGHLKYLCSCCGLNSFLLLRNFPFESQRKTAVFDLTVIGGNCPGGSLFPEWPFCKDTRCLGLPRCKNLTRFSLFVSFCFAVRYYLKCFFPLFYVIREFHRFLHRGKADVSHSSQPSSETTRKVFIYTSYQNNVTTDDPVSS